MARQTHAPRAHHGMMVLEDQGAGHARKQTQPGPYRLHLPQVANPSAGVGLIQLPPADTGYIAARQSFDQAGLMNAGNANVETQVIPQTTLPDEPLGSPDAMLIASF